jgi:hypothetical protein
MRPALIMDFQGRLWLWTQLRETVEAGTFFFLLIQSAPSSDEWLEAVRQFRHPSPPA